jgi:hypothetical protein
LATRWRSLCFLSTHILRLRARFLSPRCWNTAVAVGMLRLLLWVLLLLADWSHGLAVIWQWLLRTLWKARRRLGTAATIV